jgi:hypothetical protein
MAPVAQATKVDLTIRFLSDIAANAVKKKAF